MTRVARARRATTPAWALAAGLLLLVPAPVVRAQADYRVHYRNGILALDAQRWDEAAYELKLALDANAAEGGDPVLISGTRTEPYVPLFYMGLAYYRLGDCARAGGAWQLARFNEEVLDYPRLARVMRDGLAACDRGHAAAEASADPAVPPELLGVPEAKRPQAAQLLRSIERDVKDKRFARTRQQIEDARALGVDPARLDRLLAQVSTGATGATGDAARQGVERLAMEAFFGGDYGRAQQLLAPLRASGTLSARGSLYLACSYAASAVLSARDVDPQLRKAREAYKPAAAAGRRFEADWRFISPRLRALLEGAGPS